MNPSNNVAKLLNRQKHPFHGRNPGAWLYKKEVVSWLYEPSLRKQLPPLYRLFATYCALQNSVWTHRRTVRGALLLRSIIWLTNALGLENCTRLCLGSYVVFLDLLDPRMLAVPNELLNGDAMVLKSFLSEGNTFVDVGANHGSFSLIATKLVGANGLIVAIEPQPQLAYLLEKSLAANAKCDYQVYGIACGDRNGYADFYIPTETSGTAGLFPTFSATAAHTKISVPLRRFDDLVDWQNFPGQVFLKLDVEGSELLFLRGAGAMIRERKPHIMFEINPTSMNAADVTSDAIVHYLQELGYEQFIEVQAPTRPKPLDKLDFTRARNVIATSDTSESIS
jgi:FkbM family methyltransferase